jgi:hypothetical protein
VRDFQLQKWFDLYKTAMLELERAAMTGRIADARAEIAFRLEALQQHTGLHSEERRAIQDSLGNLLVLEKEEARLAADEKKRLLEEAARKLQALAPKFEKSEI